MEGDGSDRREAGKINLLSAFAFDKLSQISVGGSDDSDVDGNLFCPADRGDFPFLQHP